MRYTKWKVRLTHYIFSFLCCTAAPTFGAINGNGAIGPCAFGGRNVTDSIRGFCLSNLTGDTSGLFVYGTGQKFGPLPNVEKTYLGKYKAYAPFTGQYRGGLALCPGESGCTLASATFKLVSLKSFQLNSREQIYYQEGDMGGYPALTLPSPHSACTVIIDSWGSPWSSRDPTSCKDGGALPETPADCYLNANADLNVALGPLERGSIATVPAAGAPGNVKKDVPVLCTRDAGTSVSTTFQYTPLTFNGHEVISAKSNGLGVAVFYNGQLVGPSSAAITETFAVGYTSREFEFQAVRDPAVALKDIPTGNFTASATMVMTQQ